MHGKEITHKDCYLRANFRKVPSSKYVTDDTTCSIRAAIF